MIRAERHIAANERKDEFLAMLGHELRNPLAPIHNAVQVLQMHGEEATTRVWALGVLGRQVRHMTRLVDDLLDIARIGIGIEPEMLPHVFATLAQAERSRDRSRGGLGLGLALVKGLVELHGGEVSVASDGPERGSEFSFWLELNESN